MDLTSTAPRSAKDKMLGLVSLKRAIDKARAYNEGKLGEYDYDCPHDKPLFDFLGTDGDTFAARVKELGTDHAIGAWVQREFLPKKTPADIERFNEDRMRWHPDPGSRSEEYFKNMQRQLGRPDAVTWFDILDLDEKRQVPQPTKL
ncbi:MAG: DUF5069 domain-containing protein [Candidatus Eremiobacteraeota bacterium]|nr:DUF5069 domain-containing protein [Candidatus Eremiobacteraeota bacterium]MBC5828068.1 DUF5069 domain-containing protein [Candidatus Eremiobacteraeota bacterium]